jgi:hypothetical protein
VDREQDLRRHLRDLVTRTFEGADNWPDRVALFDRGIELLDPLVRAVLAELDETFLDRTGTITGRREDDVEGGVVQRWELSWPRQQSAVGRDGGPVAPVQVIAHFRRSFNHPHLRASIGGDWPMQVLDADDAKRQEPIVRAIVETEFHQRIFEGFWGIVPAMVREHGER